jgi:hypothetical protein
MTVAVAQAWAWGKAAWHKVAGSVSPKATQPVKSCTLAFKANLL